MKIRFAVAAIVAGLAVTAAHAAEPGLYFGLGAGLSAPSSSNPILIRPNNAPHLTKTTFSAGWGLLGAVGFKTDAGFRTELEAGYRQSALQHMDAGVATGHQGIFSAMGNILFDVGKGAAFQPYIGGGVGGAWVKWNNVQPTASATLPGVLPVFNDSSPAAFQYQGIVGVSFPFSAATDFFAEYRYIGTTATQFESAALAGASFTKHTDASHNLMVGVRFAFRQ
jgi:opacity protein-like surface antigen